MRLILLGVRGLLGLTLLILLGLAGLFLFGRAEPAPLGASFAPLRIADPATHIARGEARFSDIRPGNEKRIQWAGVPGEKTPVALVYLHGFSSSGNEIAPVPQVLAKEIGANLFLTRFAGHGRSGAAMAEPRVADWLADTAEAMAMGRALGDEVVLLASSTGGSLATWAASRPEIAKGLRAVILVSPNYGINHPLRPLLGWPEARRWLPPLAGRTRELPRLSEAHEAYNTLKYPAVSVLPVAALSQAVYRMDLSPIRAPALFYYSDHDRVVLASRTAEVMARWPAPTMRITPPAGAGTDPFGHVMTGDIMSPANSDSAMAEFKQWLKNLE